MHEKAGSIRMYETLPFFTGRGTLEGVYNQASLQTHAVYFLASELLGRVSFMDLAEIRSILMNQAIQMACDRLRRVFDATSKLDGRVSIEVNPRRPPLWRSLLH